MRIVSWNTRRATTGSRAWEHFHELDPDIALLQEVGRVPEEIQREYALLYKNARGKTGRLQKFGNAILVRGTLDRELELTSELDWVSRLLSYFQGNIIGAMVTTRSGHQLNVYSVYSPAWPISPDLVAGEDLGPIHLENSSDLWVTEILWEGLRGANLGKGLWLVGGDLNCSATFDDLWPGGPHGNREVLDRLGGLGLCECLSGSNGGLVPTFRNPRGGKILHQMDHLFSNQNLYNDLRSCSVGERQAVFDNSLSDHLPIIAVFEGREV